MELSPDKWKKTIRCIGMTEEKNKEQYKTGCGKEFTVTFFDLYRTSHWISPNAYTLLANCDHCRQPNNIKYSKPTHYKQYFEDDDLSNVDKRFIDKLPFKFARFFSKY